MEELSSTASLAVRWSRWDPTSDVTALNMRDPGRRGTTAPLTANLPHILRFTAWKTTADEVVWLGKGKHAAQAQPPFLPTNFTLGAAEEQRLQSARET